MQNQSFQTSHDKKLFGILENRLMHNASLLLLMFYLNMQIMAEVAMQDFSAAHTLILIIDSLIMHAINL